METTVGSTEQARASGRRLKDDLSDGVSDVKAAASSEIKSLIADVEDLMARIADLKDADVVRVRGKVQRASRLPRGADSSRRARTKRTSLRSERQIAGIPGSVPSRQSGSFPRVSGPGGVAVLRGVPSRPQLGPRLGVFCLGTSRRVPCPRL